MASPVDAIERKLTALIERASKALILEVTKELKRKPSQGGTPVDTGHARANWIPAAGSPNRTEATGSDGSLAQAGTADVLAWHLGGGLLYVSNGVPYIRKLNEGWSDQAPMMFVEAAIARAMATIKAKLGVDFATGYSASRGGEAADNMASAYSPFGD
jgi:hypothetical protein